MFRGRDHHLSLFPINGVGYGAVAVAEKATKKVTKFL